jgi:COPI associated protein/EF-hand domain pair
MDATGSATPSSTTPLISAQSASAAAATGAGLINAASSQILKAQADGPFTFRMLGFIGGLAMIVSNGIAILDRFFSFNFAGAMIAIYGVFFGIIIALLEGPFPFKERVQGGIRFHAKFLEFTWGRGALYFFVGTLQVSNWNMLDWAVGGFMIFVGITAIGAGMASARDLKLLKFSLADEAKLKEKFAAHDANGDGKLDVKELTAFVRDSGIEMNRNEIAAVFLALGMLLFVPFVFIYIIVSLSFVHFFTFMSTDKNFDEKIAYEEFYAWWDAAGAYGTRNTLSV